MSKEKNRHKVILFIKPYLARQLDVKLNMQRKSQWNISEKKRHEKHRNTNISIRDLTQVFFFFTTCEIADVLVSASSQTNDKSIRTQSGDNESLNNYLRNFDRI